MTLPPDVKTIEIVCTDSFHEKHRLIHTVLVQYVPGQAKPAKFIAGGDISTDLIRGKALYGDRNWRNPDSNQQGLSHSAEEHLRKTKQMRLKINISCRCGQFIPLKTHEKFLEYVQFAIDKQFGKNGRTYILPLSFFRFPIPPN